MPLPPSRSRRRFARPRLEALEDRLVLSGSPPTVLIEGPSQVAEGGTYQLNLAAVDPENDAVTGWTINWGDGNTTTLNTNPSSVSHVYANNLGPAALNITASAVVGGETFSAFVGSELGAFIDVFTPSGVQEWKPSFAFGRDITGPGGAPDGVEEIYASGFYANNVVVYDGATGAYRDTLMTGADGLDGARGVAYGPDGPDRDLYVVSTDNDKILRYDFESGTTSEFVGAGVLTDPSSLTFGPDGDMYVFHSFYDGAFGGIRRQVRHFDGATGADQGAFIDYIPGPTFGGGADRLMFHDGYFYINPGNNIVRYTYDLAAGTATFHDSFVSEYSTGGDAASGFDFGPDGDLYVASASSGGGSGYKVIRYDGTTGARLQTLAENDGMGRPVELLFGRDGNGDGQLDIYVADMGPGGIRRYAGPLGSTGVTSLPVTVLDAVSKTYPSGTLNKAIPSDQKTYSWSLNVADVGTVLDVDVKVDITHPYDGDLEVYLVSHSGKRVELFTRVGGSGDNFRNTTLDDEAGTAITAGAAPFSSLAGYRPEGLLSAFDGEQAQGTWKLEIRDAVKANKGTLNSWSLTITRGVAPALVADSAAPAGQQAAAITDAQMQPLWQEAVARWQAAGFDTSALANATLRVADLGGLTLGMAAGNTIWIDADAAGWGWFVDATPGDDSEFRLAGDQGEQGRMDLLSVLMHEAGHLLGHDHEAEGAMQESLSAGTRLLPAAEHDTSALDAAFASWAGQGDLIRALEALRRRA